MNPRDVRQLHRLARLSGIQTAYVDMNGKQQNASPEVLAAVLGALEVPAGNSREIRESLLTWQEQYYGRCLEPTVVAWDKQPAKIQLRFPNTSVPKSIPIHLHSEGGDSDDLVV